jgi:hypothetical protein
MHQDQLTSSCEQQQLTTELNEGNRTYHSYQISKRAMAQQRPKLKADISQPTAEINHLRPQILPTTTPSELAKSNLNRRSNLCKREFCGVELMWQHT